MFELGKSLAQIYQPLYQPSEKPIYVRATSVPRTQHSAVSFLNGFYNQANLLIPLDVYARPLETMFQPDCPAHTRLQNVMYKSNRWKDYLASSRTDRLLFTRVTGLNSSDMGKIWDQIISRKCTSNPLICSNTTCLDDAFTRRVEKYVDFGIRELWFAETAYTHSDAPQSASLNKLSIGLFVKQLLDAIQLAINNYGTIVPHRLLHVYSGHDATLSPLLGLLGAVDMRWPSYASSLVFEVVKFEDAFYVRVFYNDKVLDSKLCGTGWKLSF